MEDKNKMLINIISIRYGREENTYTSRDKNLYFEVDDREFESVADEESIHNVRVIEKNLVRWCTDFRYLSQYQKDVKKADLAQQKWLEQLCKQHYNLTVEARQNSRKDAGYINYTKNYEDVQPEDYYGLLKKYLTADTMKYLETGLVFGYLGHSERTKETDKVICEFLDENPDLINTVNTEFLTSSFGRHFMDNYENPEQLKKFLKGL